MKFSVVVPCRKGVSLIIYGILTVLAFVVVFYIVMGLIGYPGFIKIGRKS